MKSIYSFRLVNEKIKSEIKNFSSFHFSCFLLKISVILLSALLVLVSDCDGTLDLSNLDIKNFQFFRYTQVLPNGRIRNVMAPPPSIHDHFSRAKAGNISR